MTKIYQIGPFQLDPEAGILMRDGMPTVLGPRAVAVLKVLVERASEYVSKAALIDAAWAGVVVEEGNVAVQIAAIRRVLAEAPGGEPWIETLPRRGYRFVGPVTEVTHEQKAGPRQRRSNLPEALTSFIGRERELVELKRLLPAKRLVTIQGAGGIGKTRLALQVAAEVVDAYRDGVWITELASVRDPALVSATVAQSLGLAEKATAAPLDALCAYLRSRQLLLVLDNCEHLIDACARLADVVLKEAKDVTIIATSREPLRLSGEQSYVLQPLSLPEPASPATIRNSEAVQLFVERVQQQLPGFELTRERARVVAEICMHLDGIPLALELAAARARSLSVEQINTRLADRFRLLTSGSRTALPRHQTLRAALDWSYDLLAEDERTVLRRLSLFPGDFTVEAACCVASDERIEEHAVIDLVSQLVSRSLVIADTTSGASRYRLLETTRAYALEKLAEAGETEATARRHAEYFCSLFQHAPDDFLRLPDSELRASYLGELDQVRAALEWALGAGADSALGIRLTGLSAALWGTLGLFTEGVKRLEAAMARMGADTPESEQARLWLQLGRLVDETPIRAKEAFERAAALYRRLDDARGLGHTLVRLGKILAFMGKFEQSEAALSEAHLLLERTGPPWLVALYYFNMGFLKNQSGDFASARTYYEQSLPRFRQIGDEFTALAAVVNLANASWGLGDLEAAEVQFREQIALTRRSPMRTNRLLGHALMSHGQVLTEQGKLDEALTDAREGLPLIREGGSAWIFAYSVALRAGLAGGFTAAARLVGYGDAVYAANAAIRHPIDAKGRERLYAILREKLAPGELERLLAEGAKMSEDEACRLALED